MGAGKLTEKKLRARYVLIDGLMAALAWSCFFSYRKFTEYCDAFSQVWNLILYDYKFYLGIFLATFSWLSLYAICGTYRDVLRKSRIKEFADTFQVVLPGAVVLFFAVILDDAIAIYTDYIRLFAVLFALQFTLTVIGRMYIIVRIRKYIRTGKIQINALIIGTQNSIIELLASLNKFKSKYKNKLVGYVSLEQADATDGITDEPLRHLGYYDRIDDIIKEHDIKEIIAANDPFTRSLMAQIIPLIAQRHILLKVMPMKEEMILGMVKSTTVFTEPMMQIYLDLLPLWQKIFKRAMDIFVSMIFIILLSPMYLFLSIGVKLSSKGRVFFRQERIGKGGKPFEIIKFRSMYEDAEADGQPRLSSKGDSRITPFGLFMRRTHLDEIPQFFHVLVGDMSLVGPRPERQYYIDKIVEKSPYYKLLLLVKPGVTSWGQVTYGYAEDVDQMVERMRFDIMYIENMSLMMDIKILFYTLLAMLKRDGK